ncbi:EamA family transporter RarD [Halocynthiibacter styelae]|uniref:EamA family transporter RarD n=1 Tax=Halocynthiibacter styelae TaxID=2761955 RepID=A0A8J7LKD1_9RHOB|nr:EamA family transporter RarD [Paenihalocynthiibacter styelae]MBI1493760.1 EamA family transporter RarD [Paenihalocynthiibacter styelae]
MTDQVIEDKDTPKGLALAVTVYLLWGFLPLYMKLLSHIPAAEVVAHRVIWSVPIAGLVLIVMRRTGDLSEALRNPKTLMVAMIPAALVSLNWGIYVWAITSGNALDAALGYYMNPLFSILLGAIILREKLSPWQKVAVVIAGLAVAVLLTNASAVPWAAFGMMLTWGFYAFFKKSLPIGPNQGFLLEVLLLTPPAILYLIWVHASGGGFFLTSMDNTLLLLGCGVVTAVPLLIYANSAKLLRLSTIGILQYIAPTMIFLSAIFLFGEEVDAARRMAFPLIWLALVIYSVPLIRQMRAK